MKPKTKQSKLTPWQEWAQEYVQSNLRPVDEEDIDRYSHAAWNACRARVLEILERNMSSYTGPDAPELQMEPDVEYINLKAIEEIERL